MDNSLCVPVFWCKIEYKCSSLPCKPLGSNIGALKVCRKAKWKGVFYSFNRNFETTLVLNWWSLYLVFLHSCVIPIALLMSKYDFLCQLVGNFQSRNVVMNRALSCSHMNSCLPMVSCPHSSKTSAEQVCPWGTGCGPVWQFARCTGCRGSNDLEETPALLVIMTLGLGHTHSAQPGISWVGNCSAHLKSDKSTHGSQCWERDLVRAIPSLEKKC